jgi:hypothetical protein
MLQSHQRRVEHHVLRAVPVPVQEKGESVRAGVRPGAGEIELKKLEIKNSENHDFDLDKRQAETDAPPKPKDGKTEPWTFAEWCELYPHQIAAKKGTGGKRLNKDKRSFADEQRMTKLHLLPYFGAMSLIEIWRKSLTDYSSQREAETIIRQGTWRRSRETVTFLSPKRRLKKLGLSGTSRGLFGAPRFAVVLNTVALVTR